VRSAPLGKLLLETGILSQVELDQALVLQRTDRRRLGEILVSLGFINPHRLAQLLSHQMHCPWISLTHFKIEADVLSLVSEDFALEHGIVPVLVREVDGAAVLYVATADPTDDEALAHCSAEVGMPVRPMVAVTGEIKDALARYYDGPPPSARIETRAGAAHLVSPPPSASRLSVPSANQSKRTERPRAPSKPGDAQDTPPSRSLDTRDDLPLIDLTPKRDRHDHSPTILALNTPTEFFAQCNQTIDNLGARLIEGSLDKAQQLTASLRPCAIVVTDDVYAFDRAGLNLLALAHDAILLIWNDDTDTRHLTPLLTGAIQRWGPAAIGKGDVIDERYKLLRALGPDHTNGGIDQWEVHSLRTGKRSILLMSVGAAAEPTGSTALARQHKALARLNHPGVLELRDAGTTSTGAPYIVVEPLEGRTLSSLLLTRSTMSFHEACAIIGPVAEVLEAAHARGIAHRRICAEHIFVARDTLGRERIVVTGWHEATTEPRLTSDVASEPSLESTEDVRALAKLAVEILTGTSTLDAIALEAAGIPFRACRILLQAQTALAASANELRRELLTTLANVSDAPHLLSASPRGRKRAHSNELAPSMIPEERVFRRIPYQTPVRIEITGVGAFEARTEDISVGGFLAIAIPALPLLAENTEVAVRFALPEDGRVVVEPAVVRWCRRAPEITQVDASVIGVRFASASNETVRQIERYAKASTYHQTSHHA